MPRETWFGFGWNMSQPRSCVPAHTARAVVAYSNGQKARDQSWSHLRRLGGRSEAAAQVLGILAMRSVLTNLTRQAPAWKRSAAHRTDVSDADSSEKAAGARKACGCRSISDLSLPSLTGRRNHCHRLGPYTAANAGEYASGCASG